jgi:hypothetical protein
MLLLLVSVEDYYSIAHYLVKTSVTYSFGKSVEYGLLNGDSDELNFTSDAEPSGTEILISLILVERGVNPTVS